MRWPWRRRPERAGDAHAAVRGRREAERRLAEVERMAPDVQRIADRLAAEAAKNNFAALVEAAFGRRP